MLLILCGLTQSFSYSIIPILHQEQQAEIQQKVIESFSLRKHAKDLLECAKRAVEIAIDWLESVSEVIEA